MYPRWGVIFLPLAASLRQSGSSTHRHPALLYRTCDQSVGVPTNTATRTPYRKHLPPTPGFLFSKILCVLHQLSQAESAPQRTLHWAARGCAPLTLWEAGASRAPSRVGRLKTKFTSGSRSVSPSCSRYFAFKKTQVTPLTNPDSADLKQVCAYDCSNSSSDGLSSGWKCPVGRKYPFALSSPLYSQYLFILIYIICISIHQFSNITNIYLYYQTTDGQSHRGIWFFLGEGGEPNSFFSPVCRSKSFHSTPIKTLPRASVCTF